jgi:O-antigen ligase
MGREGSFERMTAAVATERRGPGQFRRILAWALIVLGLVYFTAGGGGGTVGVYLVELRVFNVAMVLVALLAWLALGLRDASWRPRSALTPAILAALAALAIADVASQQPRLGYDYVAYAVLLAGGYLLLQRLFAHPFFGPRLGMLGVLLCAGISAIYIGAVVNAWIQIWTQLGHFITPPLRPFPVVLVYGNPNPIATIVVLLWAGSVVHLGVSTTRARWALGALTALAATAVFLTGSRGAWVAFGAAVVVVTILWLVPLERRRAVVAVFRSRTVRTASIGALIVLAVVAVALLPAIARRIGEPGTDARLAFAQASLGMFLSSPLTGVGPGMWVVDRLRFTDPAAGDLYVGHAHNLVTQTAAELGIVGLLAGGIVVVLLVRLIVRGARSPEPRTKRVAWGVLFASLYFLAVQMGDLFVHLPAVAFCYALVVARLDALVVTEPPSPPRPVVQPYASVAAILALAFGGASLWVGISESAALHGDRAVNAANAFDWAAVRTSAGEAVAADPSMPPYLFTLGLSEAHAGDISAALGHLRRAAEIDDYPTTWLDVARLELDLGHPEQARLALSAAMRLGYQEPKVAVGASTLLVELGDRAAATSALASALIFAPGLASDPYWDDPVRRPLFDEALSMALTETSATNAYKIALEGRRPEMAAALIATLPPEDRLVPDLVARAWDGDAAAFADLHALAKADPLDGETTSLCRRVAERSREPGWPGGDPWACDGTLGPSAILVVRVDPPATWWTTLPGPNAVQHFLIVYRRFGPVDDLVPGLPHVGGRLT